VADPDIAGPHFPLPFPLRLSPLVLPSTSLGPLHPGLRSS